MKNFKYLAFFLWQMIQNYSRYKLLRLFFESPTTQFYMRQLSRESKLAQPSTTAHLKALLKDKLILKENTGLYPTYKANRENRTFKILKTNDIILRMQDTGLPDYIYDSCLPDVIVLFGSCTLGEDTEESDIDLFILGPEKKLDLKKHEKLLKRKVSIFFCKDFGKIPEELKNNIINGIVLRGYLRAYDKSNTK